MFSKKTKKNKKNECGRTSVMAPELCYPEAVSMSFNISFPHGLYRDTPFLIPFPSVENKHTGPRFLKRQYLPDLAKTARLIRRQFSY